MSATKLALLGACVTVALLAALWWPREESGAAVEPPASAPEVVGESPVPIALPRAADSARAPVAVPSSMSLPRTDTRASDAELRRQMVEQSYARLGSVLVDELVARGLARVDGERVVRRLFDDNAHCLFDALRLEADAQSVAYDTVLDAIQADLHETDGPLLGAVIDMAAVQSRATPCGLTAAQQAGIGPAVMEEAARAAVRRRAP